MWSLERDPHRNPAPQICGSHTHKISPRRYGSLVTLRLTVAQDHWRTHVSQVVNESDHARSDWFVPVVKGNGYGFGRAQLIELLATFRKALAYVAIGTVHELDRDTTSALAEIGATPVVLTPTLDPPTAGPFGTDPVLNPILTVGSLAQIHALEGWHGRVLIKLMSAMHRYGSDPSLIHTARTAGLDVVGVSIHPPLAQHFEGDISQQIVHWLPQIPSELEVWVSHLSPDQFSSLPDSHHYRHRIGTRLWHGDKSMFHLGADVVEIAPVPAGLPVGYRQIPTPCDGTLIMIGAGSAHGIRPLPDDRSPFQLSPFHFGSRRLDLIEPPHMHTSMAFIPDGHLVPEVTDFVDVQQPLTQVQIDQIVWR
jgi:alanine racemase